MIDPAESFSRALNQGLGIFKSYRDEARQDEDRAFNKQMALKIDERAEKALGLQMNADAREQGQYDFDYKVDPITGKSRKGTLYEQQSEVNKNNIRLTGAQASEAEFNADPTRMEEVYKLGVEDTKAGIDSKRASASASRASAYASTTQANLAKQAAAEERKARAERTAMLQALGLIGGGYNQGKVAATPEVTRSVTRMAGMMFGSNTLVEAMQNPFGSWLNDPKKVQEVMPFAYTTVRATEQARGYKDSKIVDIDANENGNFVLTFAGTNKRTGQREQFVGYAKPDQFFGKAQGYANIFRELKARPDARIRLAATVSQADPEIAEALVSREVQRTQARLKNPDLKRADKTVLERQLALLESGDRLTQADAILKGLASVEAARYE